MGSWKKRIGSCVIGLMAMTVQAADWHVEGVGTFPLPEQTTVYTASEHVLGKWIMDGLRQGLFGAEQVNKIQSLIGQKNIPDQEAIQRILAKAELYEIRSESRTGIHVALATKDVEAKADVLKYGNRLGQSLLVHGFTPTATADERTFLMKYPSFIKEEIERVQMVSERYLRDYLQTHPKIAARMNIDSMRMKVELIQIDPLTRHTWKRDGKEVIFYESGIRLNYRGKNGQRPIYIRTLWFLRGDDLVTMTWFAPDHEYTYFKPMWDRMVYQMRGEA